MRPPPARSALAALAAASLLACHTSASQPTRRSSDAYVSSLEPPRGPAPGEVELTVLTYNMNYGVAGDDGTLDVIARADADIVLLQETNAAWEEGVRARFGERYPTIRFHDPVRLAPEGIAVLSRFPIAKEQLIASPVDWFPAQRLVLDTPAGPLQIMNVHLRPMISDSGSWAVGYFTTSHYRETEVDRYARTLEPDLPTIWAGDFNEDEAAPATAGLLSSGMQSALQATAPDATTWRWDYSGIPLTQRLDHILVGRGFTVVDAAVQAGGRSDHLAVKATVRLPSRPKAER